MGIGAHFSICSFIILSVLTFMFFCKKRINNDETNIYGKILILTLFGLFLEVATCLWYMHGVSLDNIFYQYTSKLTSAYYMLWTSLFAKYVMVICNVKKNYIKIIEKLYIACFILIIVLPIKYILNENSIIPTGPSIFLTYTICTINTILDVFLCIKNRKNIAANKFMPVYSLLVIGTLDIILVALYPSLFLMGFAFTVIIIIMYHTIENPDLKLLKELHKSKEISDNANEEKTLFLYNMSQEIKDVANKIDDDADIILDSKDYNEIYDSARDIKARTSTFVSTTNDILNISQVDSSTIKVYNEKYNIKNILKQIVNVYNDLCNDKELKFRTNIDHDIPQMLYGDGIGLKEVLTTILNNSVKYTERGFVELSVNTVIKNDICRLIITIEDSGIGIKSEDINSIKVDNKSLSKANNLITKMNGTMLISSDYGVGTKVKVILDQKIEKIENSETTKYTETLSSIKLLAVDDSEAGLTIIEKLLKGTKVSLTKATTGKECIDKIKTNKYDLILLDEELSQITANELILKIKEIRNFDTPILLLTKDNSYEYKEEYLKNGFVGYILKPLKKEILIEEINKYVKKENKND